MNVHMHLLNDIELVDLGFPGEKGVTIQQFAHDTTDCPNINTFVSKCAQNERSHVRVILEARI